MSILHKLTNWYFSRQAMSYWGVLFLDSVIVMFSGYFAAYLRLGGMGFTQHFWPVTYGLLLSLLLFILCFRLFHTYRGIIRFSSFVDLKHIAIATLAASALTYIASLVIPLGTILLPDLRSCIEIFILVTLLMWLERIAVKTLYDEFRITPTTRKAFIYGVQAGGVALARSMQNADSAQYSLVGFVSPNSESVTKYIMGVKVRRDGPNLIKHIQDAGATALIVSPLQHDYFCTRQDLIDQLTAAHIQILLMNEPETWDGHSELPRAKFREVQIEDLLPRDPIEVDMTAIADTLQSKSILITGAAGSIGSEIVRQVAQFHPSHLILVDQAETPMHDLRLWCKSQNSTTTRFDTIVASITNQTYMERLFRDYRPEYVFHAAAYKHVPMMEDNPAIAVQNNVYGTRVIADLAVKYNTRKFVMVSTDKAVNPTNVMGCSKRICEIYCQSLNRAIADGKVTGTTQFVTTRFGNVLGSNGSVIPLFREQIRKGGPLTVTHPDIIRYFMLIPEACRLVLEAATLGNGGEIFVFDMGKPVRIADLANRMIALSGAKDIQIEYTGLRDGEKLFEEVLSEAERTKPTINPKIFIANVRQYDYQEALANEQHLLDLSRTSDNLTIVRKMQQIVPEYKTTNKAYEYTTV